MAKAKKTATRSSRAKTSRTPQDAITLLKADHRQVEQWFEEFQSSRSDSNKSQLAQQICQALTVHTSIEEEIFYPAFLEATQEEDIHHEAEVEHAGAKQLIAQIEGSSPQDDYFDAKVKVLSEMIKHHVREEEKRAGMFAKARQSDMDLEALGEQLATRKMELMGGAEADNDASSPRRTGSSPQRPGVVARLAKRARGE
jgi:hemerythrin superfamily protein